MACGVYSNACNATITTARTPVQDRERKPAAISLNSAPTALVKAVLKEVAE